MEVALGEHPIQKRSISIRMLLEVCDHEISKQHDKLKKKEKEKNM